MKALARELGFAVTAWLVAFVVAVAIQPVRQSQPRLFESLMAITLVATTVLLGCAYLRKSTGSFVARGARIGLVWTVANWPLDAPMFSAGPMQMDFAEYMSDIGIAYSMITVITIGLSTAAANATAR
jgi:hypothetical protein